MYQNYFRPWGRALLSPLPVSLYVSLFGAPILAIGLAGVAICFALFGAVSAVAGPLGLIFAPFIAAFTYLREQDQGMIASLILTVPLAFLFFIVAVAGMVLGAIVAALCFVAAAVCGVLIVAMVAAFFGFCMVVSIFKDVFS